jgi:hypothetical protein
MSRDSETGPAQGGRRQSGLRRKNEDDDCSQRLCQWAGQEFGELRAVDGIDLNHDVEAGDRFGVQI